MVKLKADFPSNYMFKVNNRNIKARCEICSKLTIKTPVCLFNFEHISHLILVFLSLTLSSEITARRVTLRKKCPYSELFWSVFSHIQTELGEMRSIFPYSVRMLKNTDQNKSEYGHFSHTV